MNVVARSLVVAAFLVSPVVAQDDLADRLAEFDESGPDIGDVAPAFTLPRLDGGEASLASLLAKGPVVLEFVCVSSPEAVNRADREAVAKDLAAKGAQYVLVYGREENPGERKGVFDFSWVAETRTLDKRLDLARKFRERTATRLTILVDQMDNRVWKDYGRLPNAAYVLAPDGSVLYREAWATGENLAIAIGECYAGNFQKLAAAPDKNLARVEEKKNPGEADEPPPDRPDRPGAGMAGEWERWEKRGKRIVEAAQGLPNGPRRDKVNRAINEATRLRSEMERARNNKDWVELGRLSEKFRQLVEHLEKELGIDPGDGDRGDGDRGDGRKGDGHR